MSQSVCIVSPCVYGPLTNGGIGTYVLHTAKTLTREFGCSVTILLTYTGTPPQAKHHWRDFYDALGIDLYFVEDLPVARGCDDWMVSRSHAVDWFLRQQHYDLVNFQDWQGNGFIPIQRKRTGQGYERTVLTLTMHSSSEWIDQGMQRLPAETSEAARHNWIERYCCAHVDTLLSPSRHMFEWAEANGWRLAADRRFCPNLLAGDGIPAEPPVLRAEEWDLRHWIFFGRLETRKGLEVFGDALKKVRRERREAVRKVSFLGLHSTVAGGQSSEQYLHELRAALPGLEIVIQSGLQADQALAYIKSTRGVSVMPSLLDNCPLVVLESLTYGHPFLSTTVGGIPEYADPDWLVVPDAEALAAKLMTLPQVFAKPPAHLYSRTEAVQALGQILRLPLKPVPGPAMLPVSVCIPVGTADIAGLPHLLNILDGQDYTAFEAVIVADRLSSEAAAAFAAITAARTTATRRFFADDPASAPGMGPRNRAAALARGDTLLFIDPATIPVPEMISSLVRALVVSGCAAATGYRVGFPAESLPSPKLEQACQWSYPLGAALECGISEAVFGDLPLIIRRAIFQEIGGIGEEGGLTAAAEDLLIRLSIAGHEHEVVPRYLHLHAATAGATYEDRLHRLAPYLAGRADWERRLFRDVALAGVMGAEDVRRQILEWRKTANVYAKLAQEKTKETEALAAENARLRQSLRQAVQQAVGLYAPMGDEVAAVPAPMH